MKEKNLTQGKILQSLIAFAVPVLLALFLQAMYGAVDLLIVGKYAGIYEQSGVATGSMLFTMMTMLIAGLSMGVTVLVGGLVGAGKKEEVGRGIGTAISIFLIVAVLVSVFTVPGSDFLARLMQAPQEAFWQTSGYVRICGIGAVFIVAYNVFGAVFRGIGDSKTPLLTVAIACVVNIAGDMILVAGFGMGAAGAAIATVGAQAISVVSSFLIISRRKLPFSFSKKYIRLQGYYVKKIFFVGTPIALQEMLVHFSFMFIQAVVNHMGVTESAAVGVAEKACAFLMLVASAYGQAISAFVAQNNGAGLYDRSKKALFYGMGTAFLAGLVMGIFSFFHGDLLAGVFSNEPILIVAAHEYLKAYSIDCLLTPIMFCLMGYFNGCGKTVFVMIQGVVGAFCVRIPVVFLMSRMENVTLFRIGLGTPASSVVQILLCIIAYKIYSNREKSRRR